MESINPIITVTSLNWPEFETQIRLGILFKQGKEQTCLRRAAGILKKHFETDYSSTDECTDGLDGQRLFAVDNLADIESLDDGSYSIDLMVKANDGYCYSIKEVRGDEEIFSETELLERAFECRSN